MLWRQEPTSTFAWNTRGCSQTWHSVLCLSCTDSSALTKAYTCHKSQQSMNALQQLSQTKLTLFCASVIYRIQTFSSLDPTQIWDWYHSCVVSSLNPRVRTFPRDREIHMYLHHLYTNCKTCFGALNRPPCKQHQTLKIKPNLKAANILGPLN